MKLLRVIMVMIIVFGLIPKYLLSVHRAASLAIVDTIGREAALFYPIIDIAREDGMTVDYLGIDEVMDEPNLFKRIEPYNGIIVLFGVEFLRGMHTGAPVAEKILNFIHRYSKLSGKLVGFAFPPFIGKNGRNLIRELASIFDGIGIPIPRQRVLCPPEYTLIPEDRVVSGKKKAHFFFYALNHFLTHPIESRARAYHTTLSMPCAVGPTQYISDDMKKFCLRNQLVYFPRNFVTYDSVIQTRPYGIYWFNWLRKNHVFVTTTTMCSFSGIAESFHLCPADSDKRKKMLTGMASMLHDVHIVLRMGSVPNETSANEHELIAMHSIKKFGESLVANDNRKQLLRKTAWMEIDLFGDKRYDKKVSDKQKKSDYIDRSRRQDKLIAYVLDSGLDSLWISMTPNIYYSDIARHVAKERNFCLAVSRFTKKLNSACIERKVKAPVILVGFEIADNIYAPNLPLNPAFDLYGCAYEDIPCPVDREFWDNEVVRPLQMFLQKWQDHEISHGIRIGGIVLDLEMYGRKKTNNFLSTMGFERPIISKFLRELSLPHRPSNVNSAVHLLMKRGLTRRYFSFLEQQARGIGEYLRGVVDKHVPGGVIGCYSPSILVDWFYKGLWQTLSTKKQPMQLFTFNAEFNVHRQWFDENNINVRHSSVLLLSKLRGEEDFSWINDILSRHDGIWINRFSRLVEDYDAKSWIAVEQTPMSDRKKQEFLYYLDKVR